MSKILRFICVIFNLTSLTFSFLSENQYLIFGVLIVMALTWLIAEWRNWNWFASLWLFAITTLAAFGMLIGLPALWMFLNGLCALLYWDLSRLIYRLEFAHDPW